MFCENCNHFFGFYENKVIKSIQFIVKINMFVKKLVENVKCHKLLGFIHIYRDFAILVLAYTHMFSKQKSAVY